MIAIRTLAAESRIRNVSRALLVAAVLGLAGCTTQAPEVANGDPVLIEGREIYTSQCARCHGLDGGGGRGPKLADGEVLSSFPTVEDQIALVANGNDNMPSFSGRLTEDQIEAVVRYSREVLAE